MSGLADIYGDISTYLEDKTVSKPKVFDDGYSGQKYYNPSTKNWNEILYDDKGNYSINAMNNTGDAYTGHSSGFDVESGNRYLSGRNGSVLIDTQGTDTSNTANGLFGLSKDTWGNIGTLGEIGKGLAGMYSGSKQLGLAKDKFAFDKDMINKQYAMAKDAYDKQVKRAADVGSQMRAGAV